MENNEVKSFWTIRSSRSGAIVSPRWGRIIPAGILALLMLPVAFGSCYTVASGERALVFTFSEVTAVKGEGLQFKFPYIQSKQIVDIRIRKVETPADAASKDMQTVSTAVALNYSLAPDKLRELYSDVGMDVEYRVIASRIQEVVKAITARYTAEELITQRENVRIEMAQALTSQLLEYHINVAPGGVQITNFDFSPAFNKAIEDKQIAEQMAQKAQNDLVRIQVEAEQKIAQARGEAESIRIQAEAIRAQGGHEYVQLRALDKWDGTLPQYMGGNGPIPFIEVR